MSQTPDGELIAQLRLVEDEVIAVLGARGRCMLRDLSQGLLRPTPLVVMAVGALLRRGDVRAVQEDLDVVIEPVSEHEHSVM